VDLILVGSRIGAGSRTSPFTGYDASWERGTSGSQHEHSFAAVQDLMIRRQDSDWLRVSMAVNDHNLRSAAGESRLHPIVAARGGLLRSHWADPAVGPGCRCRMPAGLQ
jgi:hypothetical protein